MGRSFTAGILGAIVLFVWGFVSWMMIPWHNMTLHSFKDGKAVADVIQANITESGMYLFPAQELAQENSPATTTNEIKAPLVFASVSLKGMPHSMVLPLIISFITQLIAATLVAWMLSKTAGLGYFRRVGFVTVFGLAAGVVSQLPHWNWFGFDTYFMLVGIADLVVGWFLAGLLLAIFCGKSIRV